MNYKLSVFFYPQKKTQNNETNFKSEESCKCSSHMMVERRVETQASCFEGK